MAHRSDFNLSLRSWLTSKQDVGRRFPVLIAALTLLPFYPLLIPNRLVIPPGPTSDYTSYQLPVHEFVRSELLDGRFPLWVPNLACGLPLHATQQMAICYPLLTPLVLVFGANLGIKLSLFLHLVIAFAGTYRLARVLAITRLSSTLAAIISTHSGFLIAHLMKGHNSLVYAYALMPWFFLALIRMLRSPNSGSALMLCWVTCCLLLSGHPQLPYYALLFGFTWWLGSLLAGEGRKHRGRVLVYSGIAALNCLLVVMIQWLPVLELLQNSTNASKRGVLEYAAWLSMDPADLLFWVIPPVWSDFSAKVPEFHPSLYYHERACYLGIVTLLLAGYSLTRKNTRTWQWGIASVVLIGSLIALGDSTFIFSSLMKIVPGLGYFRCAGRIHSVLSIMIPLLMAKGVDGLIIERAPSGSRRQLAFFGLTIIAVLVGWVVLIFNEPTVYSGQGFVQYLETHMQQNLSVCVLVLLNLALVLILCILIRNELPRVALIILLFYCGLDLMFSNTAHFQLVTPERKARPEFEENFGERPRYIESPDGDRRFRDYRIRYSRTVDVAIEFNLMLFGTNEGGVLPQATEKLFRSLVDNPLITLQLAGCDYYFDYDRNIWSEVNESLPDIYFQPNVAPHEIDTSLDSVFSTRAGDLIDKATIDGLDVVSRSTTSIRLRLVAQQPGTLVISQTLYPGWECEVNGKRCSIDSAFGVFQAIPISNRENDITVSYKPRSFYYGCCMSIIGCAMSIFLLATRRYRFKYRRHWFCFFSANRL